MCAAAAARQRLLGQPIVIEICSAAGGTLRPVLMAENAKPSDAESA
jgi:hypothetical protein